MIGNVDLELLAFVCLSCSPSYNIYNDFLLPEKETENFAVVLKGLVGKRDVKFGLLVLPLQESIIELQS